MKMQILGTNTLDRATLPTDNGSYDRNAAKRYVRLGALLMESHDKKINELIFWEVGFLMCLARLTIFSVQVGCTSLVRLFTHQHIYSP